MQMISIKPVGDRSWMVEFSGVQNPTLFMTGALAETAARRLAETLANAGRHSQLTIYLRDGSLGARFIATS
jgi:hypothetical protein